MGGHWNSWCLKRASKEKSIRKRESRMVQAGEHVRKSIARSGKLWVVSGPHSRTVEVCVHHGLFREFSREPGGTLGWHMLPTCGLAFLLQQAVFLDR